VEWAHLASPARTLGKHSHFDNVKLVSVEGGSQGCSEQTGKGNVNQAVQLWALLHEPGSWSVEPKAMNAGTRECGGKPSSAWAINEMGFNNPPRLWAG